MNVFAIELSSDKGSIAYLQDKQPLLYKEWNENFKNRKKLFKAIQDLQINWEQVDCFAIGRGPGSFSGIRTAFSVTNALAAPNKTPIYTLNSGASIAKQIALPQLTIIGDARQKKVWIGNFKGVQLQKPFQLLPIEELFNNLSKTIPVVSPDYNRLQPLLKKVNWFLPKNSLPTAIELGQLVKQQIDKKIKSEPFSPLYMHPPVFIKPRFI